ncbi:MULTISPECIES: F0F1 ATP synthase subunit delta [unclassified Exiguobacterium]|uniref:F0F1 ATP synthase subunit delta n=1 Tax=unclassified Exiguobacterium TaxID=2644629 RepID=UPI001BE7217F|nr:MULTISPECIES: F0F1 ATP synthase subunit delta [unclassified Exiguobacterium]
MNGSLAKRYAKALFDLAREQEMLDQVEAEVRLLDEVLHATPELMNVLTNPSFSDSELAQLLKDSFGDMTAIVLNTLLVMVENDRAEEVRALPHFVLEYINDFRGIAEGIVTSAYPLSESDLKDVELVFGEKLGKTLQLKNVVDEQVIGGLRVQVGYTTYDDTIETKLTRLERELLNA